jgi:hypothetical protein
MTPPRTSVVTPDRFSRAMSYGDYLASIAVNRDQFEKYGATAHPSPDDQEFFRRAAAAGAVKMLVIAEAWCPDVYRGVPVFARIAEAAGMTLRIVARDDNPDIMDEFLLNGTARAIPVAVFYTDDLRYITHFTERPAVAQAHIGALRAEFKRQYPNGAPVEEMKAFWDGKLTPHYPAWQVETIREIRELLQSALSLEA